MNFKAVREPDCYIKLYNIKSGELISNLGQYSIANGETGELIKSVHFNGYNIVYLLDENEHVLNRIYLDRNYQVIEYERLFNPTEMNLLRDGFV